MRISLVSGALFFALFFTAFTLAQMANAFEWSNARPHLTFNLASHHLNAQQEFNEFNPGLGVGVSVPNHDRSSELALEVGQYKNSLNRQSIYATASIDRSVWMINANSEVRFGAFGAFAQYDRSAASLKKRGVPSVGDWVVAVGAQVNLRISDTNDLRLRIMPAGDIADALFTLQTTIRF